MSDLSPQARRLLDGARRATQVAPPGARSRMRRSVLAATSLGAAAAAASTTKLAIVALVSAAVGAGATLAITKVAAAATSTRSVPAQQLAPPNEAPMTAPPRVPPAEPVAQPRPPEAVRLPVAAPRRHESPPAPSAPPEPSAPSEVPTTPSIDRSLEAELVAVNELLEFVDASRWPEAERALERYESQFPDGTLQTEARALEVLLRCGKNELDEARRLQAWLEKERPLNPAVRRLKTSCVATPR